jgi:hypothetical protein
MPANAALFATLAAVAIAPGHKGSRRQKRQCLEMPGVNLEG